MTVAARLIVAATGLAVAAGCPDEPPATAPDVRPNVLVIVMDTTRADHCSTDG